MSKGRKDVDEFCKELLELCLRYRLKPISSRSNSVHLEIVDTDRFSDRDSYLENELRWAAADYKGV